MFPFDAHTVDRVIVADEHSLVSLGNQFGGGVIVDEPILDPVVTLVAGEVLTLLFLFAVDGHKHEPNFVRVGNHQLYVLVLLGVFW